MITRPVAERLAAAYELHDRMLGTLSAKAGDDVTVILVSDHV
jgi:hypothetical protein